MTDILTGPPLSLNGIANKVHSVNKANGWYDAGVPPVPEQIALIHSEASEMLEADRNKRRAKPTAARIALDKTDSRDFKAFFEANLKDTVEQELADVIIRALDFAAARDIDIHSHVLAGISYNALRSYKHGDKAY